MSLQQNEVFLEVADESFQEAIDTSDWKRCEEIIADMKDSGFEKEVKDMYSRLNLARFNDIED